MADGSKMLERLKKVGSRWGFEMFIEVFYSSIIEGFRKFLAGYTTDDIPKMVKNNEFPYIDPGVFENVHGYEQYLEKISVDRLGEALVEARPDLADALVSCGVEGGVYLHKLRTHLLEMIASPEKAHEQGDTLPQTPPKDMVKAVCYNCHQSWPVAREDFDKITECPFCHTGRNQPAPSGE